MGVWFASYEEVADRVNRLAKARPLGAMLIAPDAVRRCLTYPILNSLDVSQLFVLDTFCVPPLHIDSVAKLYGWPAKRMPGMHLKAMQFSLGWSLAVLVGSRSMTGELPSEGLARFKGVHTPSRNGKLTLRDRFQASNAFLNLVHTSDAPSVLRDLDVYLRAFGEQRQRRCPPLRRKFLQSEPTPTSFADIILTILARMGRTMNRTVRKSLPSDWSVTSNTELLRWLDSPASRVQGLPAPRHVLWNSVRLWRDYDVNELQTIPTLLSAANVQLSSWELSLLVTCIGSIIAERSR